MLFLRSCAEDFTSWGGFQWPSQEGATVEAPDWDPKAECGGGLHGCSREDGAELIGQYVYKVFMVVEAEESVSLTWAHKFPSCVIRKIGTLQECLEFLGWHLEDPGWACSYISRGHKGTFPQAEEIISKDPHWASWYARKILNGRFPLGEKAIAQCTWESYGYAGFLGKPFPLGEAVIAESAKASFEYAKHILGGPFPEGEDAISECSRWSFYYAKNILKAPFPKGESILAADMYWGPAYQEFLESL